MQEIKGICMDRKTLRRYKAFKAYRPEGKIVEAKTGRRYDLVKKFID